MKTRTSQRSTVADAGSRPRRRIGELGRPRSTGARRSARMRRATRPQLSSRTAQQRGSPILQRPDCDGQAEVRLDREGIGQQGQQAAGIARGVEEVRIVRPGMSGQGKPALDQRSRRGDHEAAGSPRSPSDQNRRSGRIVAEAGDARIGRKRSAIAQAMASEQAHRQEVPGETAGAARRPRPIRDPGDGESVTHQQDHLEVHQAGVPDRGRPAEERQDHLADHRLGREQQGRGQERRSGRTGGRCRISCGLVLARSMRSRRIRGGESGPTRIQSERPARTRAGGGGPAAARHRPGRFGDSPCHPCTDGSPAGCGFGNTWSSFRVRPEGRRRARDPSRRPPAGRASLAAAALPRAVPAPDRLPRDARRGARGAVAWRRS